MRSRFRFIVALTLAAALGAFLIFSAVGGSLETYSGPGEIKEGTTYRLNAIVAPGAPKDAPEQALASDGLRFTALDKEDGQSIEVLYRGNVPDTFKDGREIVVTGTLQNGVFVAKRGTMVTLCPSKFDDKPADQESELKIPELDAT